MFIYKKPFTHIFLHVADSLYKTDTYTPYIFHFQAYDFDTKNKFDVFHKFLYNNVNTEEDRERFKTVFQKSQQIYYMLLRFYNKYSYKKSVKYDNNLDLSMEPLYKLKPNQKFKMLHENTTYIFKINDLVKIIKCDLLNHDRFFPDPKFPKNPFNNIPFTPTIFYNFYFFLLENKYHIPEIITAFYRSDLNIQKFIRENEILIRSESIKKYDKDITSDELFEEVILLLRSFKIRNLYLHIDFPRNTVISKTLNLVKKYWHSEFEFTERSRRYYRSQMFIELDNFLKNNKNFGRIYFKRGEKRELPHQDYKIHNLLAPEIPDYQSLKNIIQHMKTGTPVINPRQIYIHLDDEDDGELTQDEFDIENDTDTDMEMPPLENSTPNNSDGEEENNDDTVPEGLTHEEEEVFDNLLNDLANNGDEFSSDDEDMEDLEEMEEVD